MSSTGWFGPDHRHGTDLCGWVDNSLAGLCEAVRAAGQPRVARLLLARAWRTIDGQLRVWIDYARTEHRQPQLAQLSSPLVSLLGAADDTLRDEIAAALRGYGDHVLECLTPALRLAHAQQAAGLDDIARDSAQRLETIIARPPREEDDWSINWTGCGCGLCDTLGTFLSSRSRQVFAWPLAANGRRHLHSLIDSAGLPVRHQTQRQGRPYTLLLTKTDELFTHASTARHHAETDFAWLRSTWCGSSM